MEDAGTVGLDLTERVSQLHSAGSYGRVVCRKRFLRGQLL